MVLEWLAVVEAQGRRGGFVSEQRKQLVDGPPFRFALWFARMATVQLPKPVEARNLPGVERAVKAAPPHVVKIHALCTSRMGTDNESVARLLARAEMKGATGA